MAHGLHTWQTVCHYMKRLSADPAPAPKTSSIRSELAQRVTDRIITATLAQIEDGIEPSMRAVAIRAEIGERTLYRYFRSLEELQAATMPHLRRLVGHALCATAADLPAYVESLFTSFQTSRALSRALATAPWATSILRQTRRENRGQLFALSSAAFPKVPREDLESASAALPVPLSTAGWMYLEERGYDLAAAIHHVQWLVTTVLSHLQHLPQLQEQ